VYWEDDMVWYRGIVTDARPASGQYQARERARTRASACPGTRALAPVQSRCAVAGRVGGVRRGAQGEAGRRGAGAV
jgi:hypothetical protein